MDNENLKICAQINYSCQQTVKNPIFWLKKFRSFSNNWIKVIQSVKNTDKEIYIISYLNWKFKQGVVEYLPCYTSPAVQDDFRKKIGEIYKKWKKNQKSSDGDMEIVKILAPLTDSPNAPNKYGRTPIYNAAKYGYTEIVKFLAPLTDNPNTPNNAGQTPIQVAANAEIHRILNY